ncbi:MAG: hypothetical protein AAB437_03555 [Patescibacteria group bacterium]
MSEYDLSYQHGQRTREIINGIYRKIFVRSLVGEDSGIKQFTARAAIAVFPGPSGRDVLFADIIDDQPGIKYWKRIMQLNLDSLLERDRIFPPFSEAEWIRARGIFAQEGWPVGIVVFGESRPVGQEVIGLAHPIIFPPSAVLGKIQAATKDYLKTLQ